MTISTSHGSPAVGPEDKDLCYSSGPDTKWTQGGFCPNDADIVRTGAKSFCGMTTVAVRIKFISDYGLTLYFLPQEGIYYVINPSKEIPWTGVNELGQVELGILLIIASQIELHVTVLLFLISSSLSSMCSRIPPSTRTKWSRSSPPVEVELICCIYSRIPICCMAPFVL